jgi:SSS family transporter
MDASSPLLLAQSTGFRAADWVVLALYLGLLVATGIWFSRRESKSTHEYFLAGRKMPMWAVSVSIIATSLSAATFVGAPEQSYVGDLTYLSTNIGGLIAVIVVAFVFIPAFYKNNCTTVYELLERRFGTSSKEATSAAFMIGRLFASGARIYIGAIPLSMILFGSDVASSPNYVWCMVASIGALAVAGTFYTLWGGIASVIWTDVIQTVVLVIAVIGAIVVLYNKIDLPVGEIVSMLKTGGADGASKLTILKSGLASGAPSAGALTGTGAGGVAGNATGIDFAAKYTLLTAIFGFSLLNIAAYGTDHDLVQRMLTCKNAIQGGRSVLLSLAIGVPLVTAFLVVGLLLWVWHRDEYVRSLLAIAEHDKLTYALYPSPDGPADYSMPNSKFVFVHFILTSMPPGLAGLMLAGLFAAGVGSLTSAINAMAATFIKDFYTRWAPGKGDAHYLSAGRVAVVGWGVALAGFAVLCLFWQRSDPNTSLIDLALGVMSFAYAGLLGVFLTALFTRRGNARSVIAALVTGFLVIALLQPVVWAWWTRTVGLPSSIVDFKLAFPWHMTIGSTLAFLVCVSGRPDAKVRVASDAPNTCSACGYSKDGLGSAKCPECGSALAQA